MRRIEGDARVRKSMITRPLRVKRWRLMWKLDRFRETGIGLCLEAPGPVKFEVAPLEALGVLLSHQVPCHSIALQRTQVADSHSLDTY